MVEAWSVHGENDVVFEEPVYFDATPEGSVIFDWDVTAPGDSSGGCAASSSTPFCTQGSFFASTAQNGATEECEHGGGSKKTRPPKLVREVRDLQESFRQLSREVLSKAESADMRAALDQKASQWELDEALHLKANAQDLQLLGESVGDKVGSAMLEDVLQQKVSQSTLQDALNGKVSQEHFQHLRHRVKNKLDSDFGVLMKEGLDQKASHSDLHQLWYNVEGKADRSSVQSALSQKVSWSAVKSRMVSCGVLWVLTVCICAVVLGSMFYLLLRQQQELRQLSSLNAQLSGTIDQINIHHLQLNHSFAELAAVKQIMMQSVSPMQIDAAGSSGSKFDIHGGALVHNQVFRSATVHEDTYTVELVPPFSNAWVIVDASLGAAGIVCSGKADAILRTEHKIFSFYAPPGIEDTTPAPAIEHKSLPQVAGADSDDLMWNGAEGTLATVAATTTTTTTPKACMIMTTSLQERQGGSIVVLINFKRDPDSLLGFNNSHIYNVSGKVQWFPQ